MTHINMMEMLMERQEGVVFESRSSAPGLFLFSFVCFCLVAWRWIASEGLTQADAENSDANVVLGCTVFGIILFMLGLAGLGAKSQLVLYPDRIEYVILQGILWNKSSKPIRRQILPLSVVTRIRHYPELEKQPMFFVDDKNKRAWYIEEHAFPIYSKEDWTRLMQALERYCPAQIALSKNHAWPDDDSEPWILPGWRVRSLIDSETLQM